MTQDAALQHRRLAFATLLLLALCLLRGAALWLHEPMIGLANNYDMIRAQGCIDAYPLRDDGLPPYANSWQGPIERYAFRDDVDPGCFVTSEAVFAFAALPLMRQQAAQSGDSGFSLRLVGGLKLLALFAFVACGSALWWRAGRTGAAVVNAAVAAVVLFDPGVLIYLNTLYAEFAAVAFAYLAILLVALGLASTRASWLLGAAASVAIVLACLSKVQHLAFGLLLAASLLFAMLLAGKRDVRLAACVAVAAAFGLAIQLCHLQLDDTQSMRRANLTNTVLQAVLGSSNDPRVTAEHLGLPTHCAEHAGKTWFSDGVQANHPCPELFELGRARIAYTLLREPATGARFLATGLGKAVPWIPALLGKVEGGVSAPVPAYFPSLDSAVQRLGATAIGVLLFAPALLLALLVRAKFARRSIDTPLLFAATACAAYAPFSFLTVILGDGFADVAKQFHLGMTMLLAFWVGAALLGLRAMRSAARS